MTTCVSGKSGVSRSQFDQLASPYLRSIGFTLDEVGLLVDQETLRLGYERKSVSLQPPADSSRRPPSEDGRRI